MSGAEKQWKNLPGFEDVSRYRVYMARFAVQDVTGMSLQAVIRLWTAVIETYDSADDSSGRDEVGA